jgi:hypothetical protein
VSSSKLPQAHAYWYEDDLCGQIINAPLISILQAMQNDPDDSVRSQAEETFNLASSSLGLSSHYSLFHMAETFLSIYFHMTSYIIIEAVSGSFVTI